MNERFFVLFLLVLSKKHFEFVFLLHDRRYDESPVCKINVAVFSSFSLLPKSLVCSWTAIGHTLFLLSAEVGISAVYVRLSGLQDRLTRDRLQDQQKN